MPSVHPSVITVPPHVVAVHISLCANDSCASLGVFCLPLDKHCPGAVRFVSTNAEQYVLFVGSISKLDHHLDIVRPFLSVPSSALYSCVVLDNV